MYMWCVKGCTLLLRCWFFFFFFQAEDGIRDYKVTGVQTCALPISSPAARRREIRWLAPKAMTGSSFRLLLVRFLRDRKSTRLNSSHLVISYAVFCLKKKKKKHVHQLLCIVTI